MTRFPHLLLTISDVDSAKPGSTIWFRKSVGVSFCYNCWVNVGPNRCGRSGLEVVKEPNKKVDHPSEDVHNLGNVQTVERTQVEENTPAQEETPSAENI